MSRIFISYKRVDKDKVFKIKDQIESALGEKCWIDLDGIESDAVFASKIIGAINSCEVFLFMYSREHREITDYENDWTIRELNFAQEKKKRIVFINIDGSELTDWFKLLFGTKQQIGVQSSVHWRKLLVDLRIWLNDSTVRESANITISPGETCKQIHEVSISKINYNIGHYIFIALTWFSAMLFQLIFIFLFFYDGPRVKTWNARFLEISQEHIVKDTFIIPSMVALIITFLFYYPICSDSKKPIKFRNWLISMVNAIAIDFVIYIFTHFVFLVSAEFWIKGLIYTFLTIIFYFIYSLTLVSR